MNQMVLNTKIVQYIEEEFKNHGKKLEVILELLKFTDNVVFTGEDFSFHLGELISEWLSGLKGVIEKSVKECENSSEYILHRAKFIYETVQGGGRLKCWIDDIKEITPKLEENLKIFGNCVCKEEPFYLAAFSDILENYTEPESESESKTTE
jgi:hypothetical protein